MTAPDIWEEIVACRRRGEAAALATIVSTLGSTPGKDPMKMLVRSDGTFVGSVGGGCLEAEVWDHARTVMRTLRPMTVQFTLTEKEYPDSGLVCGGVVTVFIEPVTQPVVHVFGAGHVGAATARLSADAGFAAIVYDDRPDMLDAARLPPPIALRPGAYEDTVRDARFGDVAYVIVVTRGHHDDERVLRALAAAHVTPRFLGMIGSRTKRGVLLGRLAADGVPAAWLDQIRSPVGLPIGARTAAEIAVSIVAQLVALTRTGRPEPAPAEQTRTRPTDAAGAPPAARGTPSAVPPGHATDAEPRRAGDAPPDRATEAQPRRATDAASERRRPGGGQGG